MHLVVVVALLRVHHLHHHGRGSLDLAAGQHPDGHHGFADVQVVAGLPGSAGADDYGTGYWLQLQSVAEASRPLHLNVMSSL